jgi:DNA-binding NarL/FixJ family response regulator
MIWLDTIDVVDRAGPEKMKLTRILLADDDLPLLETLNVMLRSDFDVVDTVSDGPSLVEAAFKLHPDVIVTDISMPKMNGIDAVRTIRCVLPDIKFVILTMHDGEIYRREARNVGAAAYVLKSAIREELGQAIQHAIKGAV